MVKDGFDQINRQSDFLNVLSKLSNFDFLNFPSVLYLLVNQVIDVNKTVLEIV